MANRIPDSLLPANNYNDGDVLYGADINLIVDTLKLAINANKADSDALLSGQVDPWIRDTKAALDLILLEVSNVLVNGEIGFVLRDETVGEDTLDKVTMYEYNETTNEWDFMDSISFIGMYDAIQAILSGGLTAQKAATLDDDTNVVTAEEARDHIDNTTNPHEVTKDQVGLGNVDNTSDADKPISTAAQTALDGKVDDAQVLTDVPAGAVFTDTQLTNAQVLATVLTDLITNSGGTVVATDTILAAIGKLENRVAINDAKETNQDGTIIDNLTSVLTTASLSANQGRVLKGYIDTINSLLLSDESTLDTLQEIVDFIELNKATLDTLAIANIAGLQTALDGKVDDSQVLTNVPAGAIFTDTIYTLTKAAVEAVLTGTITSHNHDGVYQIAGTYNTVIGTDTDIDTTGAVIVDNIYVTDGVITSMGTRTLTLADLGYTGATDANKYVLTKAAVEAVLTGAITSHTHNYAAPNADTTGKAGSIDYVTTCPTAINTSGIKKYVGTTDCATKYAGWEYNIIEE